jgi:hypothetical protein
MVDLRDLAPHLQPQTLNEYAAAARLRGRKLQEAKTEAHVAGYNPLTGLTARSTRISTQEPDDK